MNEPLMHTHTRKQLEAFVSHPSHAVLLVAPAGAGKGSAARWLAGRLLNLAPDRLEHYPYLRMISSVDGKPIGIETIRELEHFLSLKVPLSGSISRIVIIEDSHLLGQEAQNALLKTLEEPPNASLFILTTGKPSALLPTVHSRLQTLALTMPAPAEVVAHFTAAGYQAPAINQALVVSGGLPGLMQALLGDEAHHLKPAIERARTLLQQSGYDRLLAVDELAKQRMLSEDVVFILQQMAHVSLQTAEITAAGRWQRILSASYDAERALTASAQPKLVLTNLMLSLS